jgi:hypothetical protein
MSLHTNYVTHSRAGLRLPQSMPLHAATPPPKRAYAFQILCKTGGRIVLKLILTKWGVSMWTIFTWIMVAGSCVNRMKNLPVPHKEISYLLTKESALRTQLVTGQHDVYLTFPCFCRWQFHTVFSYKIFCFLSSTDSRITITNTYTMLSVNGTRVTTND